MLLISVTRWMCVCVCVCISREVRNILNLKHQKGFNWREKKLSMSEMTIVTPHAPDSDQFFH